jgi:hypothetical protein
MIYEALQPVRGAKLILMGTSFVAVPPLVSLAFMYAAYLIIETSTRHSVVLAITTINVVFLLLFVATIG